MRINVTGVGSNGNFVILAVTGIPNTGCQKLQYEDSRRDLNFFIPLKFQLRARLASLIIG